MTSRLATTAHGTGPRQVLLLHGFLGSGRNLGSFARAWAAADPSLRLTLVDLPGHGDSPPLGATLSLTALAEPVHALATLLGVERWVGHSLGGRVALAARRLSTAPAPVTLLDIGPSPLDDAAGELTPVLEALLAAPESAPDRAIMAVHIAARGLPEGLTQWLLQNLRRGHRGVTWNIQRARLGALADAVRQEDLWDTVPLAPVHCIRGGRSAFVSDSEVARLRALGAQVDTIPEAGHFLHVDDLGMLVRLVTSRGETHG